MRRSAGSVVVGAVAVGVLVLLAGAAVAPVAGAPNRAAGPGSAQLTSVAQGPSAVKVLPNVDNFALPPTRAGCGGALQLPGGASRIPITVSEVKGQVEELVNVCVDGKGPFPFEIDTGAGISVVASSLATQLALPALGASATDDGIGCSFTVQPVAIAAWSVGGVNLAPQPVISGTLPDFGIPGQPVGLLGSDVLLRFGAVRIDFVHKSMILAGPEGGVPSGNVTAHGETGPLPTGAVLPGRRGTSVPTTVVLTPGAVAMDVRIRFGHGPSGTFNVDTGTTQSEVDSAVARSQHLVHTNLVQTTYSSCATINAPLVHSGPWSIPGVPLQPQLIESSPFGPATNQGVYGTLGSDQLIRFHWVVFDYTGGRLILG